MRAIFILLLAVGAYSHAFAEYQVFYENGKAGVRDDTGNVIIPASFDALGWADGSFSVINQVTGFRQKGKWGLINLKKEFVTKAEYETVTSRGGDRVIASKHINPYTIKFGLLDLTGKVTVPFTYDGLEIHGLRAIVFIKNGVKYEHGLIDLTDKSILPVRYRDIRPIGSLRFAIQNFEKKTALYSEEGLQLTDFVIDSISAFKKGSAIIYQNFQQGLIDREGTIIVSPTYREIRVSDEGVVGRASDSWKIIDTFNKEVKSIEADELIIDGNNYLLTRAGKYGTVGDDLDPQIPVAYDHLDQFRNNLSVARKDNKYGLVSSKHKQVFPFEFDSLILENNFVRAMKKSQGQTQWMLYDTFNVKKSDRYYESLQSYNGQFFRVMNRGHWGAVDRYGKEILGCVYDSIIEAKYDAVHVKFKGLYGIIGTDERWRVYPQKNHLTLVDAEHYLERQDTMQFLKTVRGEVIYFTSNKVKIMDGYLEETSKDGSVRQVSLAGVSATTIASPRVDKTEEVFEESEGYRGIRRNGQYGFIDARGRLRIANRYEGIGKFKEGLAPVMILGKWGYVNTEDRVVINPNFQQAGDFRNGIAIVRRNDRAGAISHDGTNLLPLRYDSIIRTSNLLAIYEKGHAGLSDTKGHVLIEPRFDHLELLPNNLVIVRDGMRWGVLTIDGMPVVPLIYSFIKYNPSTNHFLANQKSEWRKLKTSN
jgi:WG containing repeat